MTAQIHMSASTRSYRLAVLTVWNNAPTTRILFEAHRMLCCEEQS